MVDQLSISRPPRAPLQKRLLRHKRGNRDGGRKNSWLAAGATLADRPTPAALHQSACGLLAVNRPWRHRAVHRCRFFRRSTAVGPVRAVLESSSCCEILTHRQYDAMPQTLLMPLLGLDGRHTPASTIHCGPPCPSFRSQQNLQPSSFHVPTSSTGSTS